MSLQDEKPRMPWYQRIVTEPRDELGRWEKALRFPYDLGRYGARQLRQDRAPQMAGALAFRTLFALLPVLVVGTLLIRAVGGFAEFRVRLADFFTSFGLDEVTIVEAKGYDEGTTLSEWLVELISVVERVNLTAITWVGVFVLIYSALSLMVTIENSFNHIYRAPGGRRWLWRLPIYWTVLTIGPAAIATTMYVSARFDTQVAEHGGWVSVFRAAPVIWSVLASWVVTFGIYKFVPNTHVAYRPALVGSFVAAVVLEFGKGSLVVYFENALSFRQLYGSLGLVPVFMFWVYLMWLVILFGLEVSATLQMLGGRRLEDIERKRENTGLLDPASVLLVMEVIAENFERSHPTSARELADATSVPETTLVRMLDGLVQAGVLHRLDREDGAVTLSRPPEQISADQLIEYAFRMVDEGAGGRRSAMLQRLREVQRNLLSRATLATLATPSGAMAGGDQAAGES